MSQGRQFQWQFPGRRRLKVADLRSTGQDTSIHDRGCDQSQANQRLKGPGSTPTSLDLHSSGGKIYVLCADGTTQAASTRHSLHSNSHSDSLQIGTAFRSEVHWMIKAGD